MDSFRYMLPRWVSTVSVRALGRLVGHAECGPVADAPFRRSESLDTVERGFLVGEQLNIACRLDCCGLDCWLKY
jgi:hypothetical protein